MLDTGESVTGLRVGSSEDGVTRTFACATTRWRRRRGDRHVGKITEVTDERGILREVIARAPAPMAVMLGDELVFHT